MKTTAESHSQLITNVFLDLTVAEYDELQRQVWAAFIAYGYPAEHAFWADERIDYVQFRTNHGKTIDIRVRVPGKDASVEPLAKE